MKDKIRNEWKKKRTKIISKMLDNPNELGIYPTSVCYYELDTLFEEIYGSKFFFKKNKARKSVGYKGDNNEM